MVEGRIIRVIKPRPTGPDAEWYEIETVHNGKAHRDSKGGYGTEDKARKAAAELCDWVDPDLY
jgi:hypothetical protein